MEAVTQIKKDTNVIFFLLQVRATNAVLRKTRKKFSKKKNNKHAHFLEMIYILASKDLKILKNIQQNF
jgi:hypothetical protein